MPIDDPADFDLLVLPGDDGCEEVTADNRMICVHRGGFYKDKPEDLRAPRPRVSEAKRALAWRGLRVALELGPA